MDLKNRVMPTTRRPDHVDLKQGAGQMLSPNKPWAVPVFSANKLWRSSDDTKGYLRRWVIIPFPHELDRTKKFDESLLQAEASGIFNKAVANLSILMERGAFAPNGAALDVMDEFRTQNDPVRMWLKDTSSVYTIFPSDRMSRDAAYEAYRWWCISNGYKPKGSRDIYSRLRREGFEEQSSNGTPLLRWANQRL